ncbi:hypothetical protein AB6D11_24860 [Vibrio splendidus]
MNKNHDKALTELPEFRWTIGGLAFVSAILFGVIACNSSLKWQWDYEGFNFFVKAFSVPIAVLTSIIPIVGFIALNHRSVQTKEQIAKASMQIELAQEQNLFSNYYKHREEFIKYSELLKEPLNCERIDGALIHNNLFPNVRKGGYEPFDIQNSTLFQEMTIVLSRCERFLESGSFRRVDNTLFLLELDELFKHINAIAGTSRQGHWQFDDTISPVNLSVSIQKICLILYQYLTDYYLMAKFEKDVKPPKAITLMYHLGEFTHNFKPMSMDHDRVTRDCETHLISIKKALSSIGV